MSPSAVRPTQKCTNTCTAKKETEQGTVFRAAFSGQKKGKRNATRLVPVHSKDRRHRVASLPRRKDRVPWAERSGRRTTAAVTRAVRAWRRRGAPSSEPGPGGRDGWRWTILVKKKVSITICIYTTYLISIDCRPIDWNTN